jgi:UDP-glucose 4-epimerase
MKFLVTGATGFIGERVVANLVARGIPVVATDIGDAPEAAAKVPGAHLVAMDVSDERAVSAVFEQHPDITHCIHLAYLMSAEVEANPAQGVKVNVLGMVHLFEAALRHKLKRVVYASSETYYGASQAPYGDRPVHEEDFTSPAQHFFTYGMMKVLNEFMAGKFAAKHGLSLVSVRPPVVFGHGRKRGSVLWAEAFATNPALGLPAEMPFSADSRETWIYKDDCAEQMIRLAIAPTLSHAAYNNGGECVNGHQLAAAVRRWIPDAQFTFDESKPTTPLIDWQDGSRLEKEVSFTPRPLVEGVRAHINQARAEAGLPPV